MAISPYVSKTKAGAPTPPLALLSKGAEEDLGVPTKRKFKLSPAKASPAQDFDANGDIGAPGQGPSAFTKINPADIWTNGNKSIV